MSNKLLLILQYSGADFSKALGLANLIADLEPVVSPYADFCLSCSATQRPNLQIEAKLKQKFEHVYSCQCKRLISGWPAGPNNQICETARYVLDGYETGGWDYKAFFFMEGDSVPLAADWIKRLSEEWDEGDQQILGPMLFAGDPLCNVEHVNGNLIMSPKFLLANRDFAMKSSIAPRSWDTDWWPKFKPVSRGSKLIWSDYKLGMGENPWKGCDYLWATKRYTGPLNPLRGVDLHPVWFHGIKVTVGITCARAKLLHEPMVMGSSQQPKLIRRTVIRPGESTVRLAT